MANIKQRASPTDGQPRLRGSQSLGCTDRAMDVPPPIPPCPAAAQRAKEWLSPVLLNTRARNHSDKAEYARFTCMEIGLMLFNPLVLIVTSY